MKANKRYTVLVLLAFLYLFLFASCKASKRDKVIVTQTEDVAQDVKSYSVEQIELLIPFGQVDL